METTIDTKYGKVKGIKKDGTIQFLGIPFAKPPVNDLAFRYPVEVDCWTEIFDATRGSKNPIQHVGHTGSKYQSQDCLYLNIFVPENVTEIEKKNLPVMVWIFGGSYAEGGAGARKEGDEENLLYDFSKLAKENEVIVVTFNYRLNLYGFLNLNFLSDRFDRNIGLFDQIMALKFINENISFFGGDSKNITLFGQSAGGACILALMSMKEAENLFQKSIVMSPCVEHFFTEEESEKNTREYLKILKIKENELDKLFDLTKEQVDLANKKFSNRMRFRHLEMRCAFSPTIDGITLNDEPKILVKSSTKPLIIGNVKEEANPFVMPIPAIALFFMSKLMKLDIPKSEKSFKLRVRDAVSQKIYITPVDEILKEYKGEVWRYQYNFTSPDSKERGMGCFHFCDVPILMGKSVRVENVDDDESQKVGFELRKIYSDFAKTSKTSWEMFKENNFVQNLF